MSSLSTCPGLEDFAKYLLGQLPEPGRAALTTHLLGCSTCAATMRQLKSGGKPSGRKNVSLSDLDLESLDESSWGPLPVARADQPPAAGHTLVSNQDDPLLAPAQEAGEIGRLGPYRILKVLGTGGMGIVYQAEDEQLRRTVALKVMKPEYSSAEKARQRFLREARAMGALEHDNIVRIYQVGEDRGLPYMAMQILRGETLADLLDREGKLATPEIVRIGREIASGLAAAHKQGVIHRDIKPGNVWLEEDTGRVKILDFGLARSADDMHLTQTGTVVGTPEYMSPEQAQGKTIDQRTDLFSLGSVLYHMCSGRPPFHVKETMATLMAVISKSPTALTEYNRDLPEILVILIVRLLAKQPDDRPPSAEFVAGALQEIEQFFGGISPSASPAYRRGKQSAQSSARLFIVAMLLSALSFAGYWFGSDIVRFLKRTADQMGVQLPK